MGFDYHFRDEKNEEIVELKAELNTMKKATQKLRSEVCIEHCYCTHKTNVFCIIFIFHMLCHLRTSVEGYYDMIVMMTMTMMKTAENSKLITNGKVF